MVLSLSLLAGCCHLPDDWNTALPCTAQTLQSGIASLHRQDISGQPRHTPGPLNLTETVRRSLTAAEIVFYVKFKNQNKP